MARQFFTAFLILIAFTATAQRRIFDEDVKELIIRMEGTFDNAEQYAQDKNYNNTTLHVKRIWKKRKDGNWFYSEQTPSDRMEEPFFQSVYHISRKDNETMEAKIYQLPAAERFVGAWQKEDKFKIFRKDSLIETTGCALMIKLNEDGDFWGTTPGKDCKIPVEGTAYFTSSLTIYPTMLVSWDKGFDANDKQVSGPEKGGYRFRKWNVLSTRKDD